VLIRLESTVTEAWNSWLRTCVADNVRMIQISKNGVRIREV